VIIFQVSKKLSKKSKIAKNNRKQTAILSHQKFFNYRKKNRIHWSRSLSHRTIASHLVCVTIIAKCLWCDCRPWFYQCYFHKILCKRQI